MGNSFPYRTIIDRVITDEKGNILFGENPGNIRDTIQIDNQGKMLSKMDTQITKQNTMINSLNSQVQKQQETITNLADILDKANTQITNQESVIGHLQTMINKQNQQTANQVTQISNQDEILARLQETFDVVINGNVMELYGSSTDTKPTGVKIGTTFFEYDTTDAYMYTGSMWVAI